MPLDFLLTYIPPKTKGVDKLFQKWYTVGVCALFERDIL